MDKNIPIFIDGVEAYLRPLTDSDVNGPYIKWLNDPEVCRFNRHHVYPQTKEDLQNYISKARTDKTMLVLAICDKKTDLHLGNVSLTNIDPISRKAEFSIILGEKSAWNRGIGFFSFISILKHGFISLNLNRIEWGTTEDNLSMIKMSEKVKAIKEGTRRKAHFKNGKYVDIFEYGLLCNEFKDIK